MKANVRRIEAEKLFPREIRKVLIDRRDKVVRKDSDFAVALSRPPAVVAGYPVVLGQDLDEVALAKLQLVVALRVVLVDGHPKLKLEDS